MYIERILKKGGVSFGNNGIKVRPNSKILVNIVMAIHEKGMDSNEGKRNEKEILFAVHHYKLTEGNGDPLHKLSLFNNIPCMEFVFKDKPENGESVDDSR